MSHLTKVQKAAIRAIIGWMEDGFAQTDYSHAVYLEPWLPDQPQGTEHTHRACAIGAAAIGAMGFRNAAAEAEAHGGSFLKKMVEHKASHSGSLPLVDCPEPRCVFTKSSPGTLVNMIVHVNSTHAYSREHTLAWLRSLIREEART